MIKSNKICLSIIIALTIMLIIMTCLYFNMRTIAQNNLDAYLQASKEKYELNIKNQYFRNAIK